MTRNRTARGQTRAVRATAPDPLPLVVPSNERAVGEIFVDGLGCVRQNQAGLLPGGCVEQTKVVLLISPVDTGASCILFHHCPLLKAVVSNRCDHKHAFLQPGERFIVEPLSATSFEGSLLGQSGERGCERLVISVRALNLADSSLPLRMFLSTATTLKRKTGRQQRKRNRVNL